MTIELDKAHAALIAAHPTPWYLERCNPSGVEVRDTRGNTVFAEEFDAPPELGANVIEEYITGKVALARYLVAMSTSPNTGSEPTARTDARTHP